MPSERTAFLISLTILLGFVAAMYGVSAYFHLPPYFRTCP